MGQLKIKKEKGKRKNGGRICPNDNYALHGIG
jgi:hypothetical protein